MQGRGKGKAGKGRVSQFRRPGVFLQGGRGQTGRRQASKKGVREARKTAAAEAGHVCGECGFGWQDVRHLRRCAGHGSRRRQRRFGVEKARQARAVVPGTAVAGAATGAGVWGGGKAEAREVVDTRVGKKGAVDMDESSVDPLADLMGQLALLNPLKAKPFTAHGMKGFGTGG